MEVSPASPPRIFWNSRKRSAGKQSLNNDSPGNLGDHIDNALGRDKDKSTKKEKMTSSPSDLPTDLSMKEEEDNERKPAALSERRKALFEPLEPISGSTTRTSIEALLLPPPDFDVTSYPKGWLLGKRRKLVNVDVVESMRRIAVHEMNRKDREIDGLNEQLEEDARCIEHMQLQLLQERSKRAEIERENTVLQDQISMLMNMLDEAQGVDRDEATTPDS